MELLLVKNTHPLAPTIYELESKFSHLQTEEERAREVCQHAQRMQAHSARAPVPVRAHPAHPPHFTLPAGLARLSAQTMYVHAHQWPDTSLAYSPSLAAHTYRPPSPNNARARTPMA